MDDHAETRMPRKGDRVRLLKLDMEFTIRAVRPQNQLVDLQLVDEPHAIMNDVPWRMLVYRLDRTNS